MFAEYRMQKIFMLCGLLVAAGGCFMLHPVLGCIVLGIGMILFGIITT